MKSNNRMHKVSKKDQQTGIENDESRQSLFLAVSEDVGTQCEENGQDDLSRTEILKIEY